MKTEYLLGGQICLGRDHLRFITLLGSCVSVLITDKSSNLAGMIHYLLPIGPSNETEVLRYGNTAIPILILELEKRGAHRSQMQAMVFGGAKVVSNMCGEFNIGEQNIEMAFDVLSEFSVPVVAKHIGGEAGRRITYDLAYDRLEIEILSNNRGSRETAKNTRFGCR